MSPVRIFLKSTINLILITKKRSEVVILEYLSTRQYEKNLPNLIHCKVFCSVPTNWSKLSLNSNCSLLSCTLPAINKRFASWLVEQGAGIPECHNTICGTPASHPASQSSPRGHEEEINLHMFRRDSLSDWDGKCVMVGKIEDQIRPGSLHVLWGSDAMMAIEFRNKFIYPRTHHMMITEDLSTPLSSSCCLGEQDDLWWSSRSHTSN